MWGNEEPPSAVDAMNEPWDDRPGDLDPLIVRAWKVFVSPGEVFRALAREPSALGHLFFFLEEGWTSRFLGYVDLFNVWAFALVGIGASVVDGERSAGPAIGVGVGIIVLLAMAVAAVTG
jgi:hypothetical protein